MADVYTGAREINPGTEMNGNGESRLQVPTWSVANAKEAKPQIIERSDEPEVSKPEAKAATLNRNLPRYDGDFDIERHDYWWNLLDMENPRHARASKALYGHPERQQRTGFPLLKVGSARKRDDMDDEDSRSPPAELAAKRPRLSSYSGGFSGDGRLSNATPSRPTFDAPPSINGRHYSPVNVPGSVPERERNGANGDSARSARHEMDARQYYDSHDSRNDDRYQNHDRYEVSARDMNNLFNLVDKLQREVRTLRSRLDGMETRVDNISGAVDIYRP
ncbi:unnamed protein product [Aureobasidium pullulans]|nr:unnamed protein product [Aureobasidium pullulans]